MGKEYIMDASTINGVFSKRQEKFKTCVNEPSYRIDLAPSLQLN